MKSTTLRELRAPTLRIDQNEEHYFVIIHSGPLALVYACLLVDSRIPLVQLLLELECHS